MVSIGTVNRLVSTSGDFDLTGLQIIGYYLRLYAIELLLSEQERSAELTELATELLTTVESYRDSVKSTDASELGNPVYGLVHDQEKANMYLSNFALSLYNGKLKQVQEGPWDYTLQRGLWCCIDLFSCISHLWGDEDGSVKRRLKYCKVYLSKLVKGELGPGKESEQESEQEPEQESEQEVSRLESPGAKLDYQDFLDDEPEETVSEMVSRLKAAADEEDTEEEHEQEEIEEDEQSADISLPLAPDNVPETRSVVAGVGAATPDFIDSDEAEDETTNEAVPEPTVAPVVEKRDRYTKEQLHTMLERSAEIEKVQKMAKYAISALNYEDVATAKDELTKALEVLDLL